MLTSTSGRRSGARALTSAASALASASAPLPASTSSSSSAALVAAMQRCRPACVPRSFATDASISAADQALPSADAAGAAAGTTGVGAASTSPPQPSVRMLAEAGIIVSPARVKDRYRHTRQKGVTQQLLETLDNAKASASAIEGEASNLAPPLTAAPSPFADTVFPLHFRRARARLWTPTASEARQAEEADIAAWLRAQVASYADSLSSIPRKQAAFALLSLEEQLDLALLPTWQGLSAQEQASALLRARFEAIRKLGWRRGFSAGFPTFKAGTDTTNVTDADLRQQLQIPALDDDAQAATRALIEAISIAKDDTDILAAQRELFWLDEARAWASWKAMPESVRAAEERDAWSNRDRSRVYIDNTPSSSVCLQKAARWFAEPQRAGPLNFLPNIIVRLVRNYTPPGQQYDVWKATFRVPLSMHKHALRSYLLAIYGLRTTWSRSMIYRTKLSRSVRHGGGLRPGKDRTYKKVEVGLLEPFLWPGVSTDFLQNRMLVHEMKVEAQRAYLKMTRTARWRARRAADPLHDNIAESLQHGSLDKGKAAQLASRKPIVLTKGGGVPTAKHGRILAMLLEKKRERQAAIREIIRVRTQVRAEATAV
ncbi:hypothetical protein OC835_004874 [Tilletia horrida]|nr:hypothetical protein OC835_004874 [Tilletia horrida]